MLDQILNHPFKRFPVPNLLIRPLLPVCQHPLRRPLHRLQPPDMRPQLPVRHPAQRRIRQHAHLPRRNQIKAPLRASPPSPTTATTTTTTIRPLLLPRRRRRAPFRLRTHPGILPPIPTTTATTASHPRGRALGARIARRAALQRPCRRRAVQRRQHELLLLG